MKSKACNGEGHWWTKGGMETYRLRPLRCWVGSYGMGTFRRDSRAERRFVSASAGDGVARYKGRRTQCTKQTQKQCSALYEPIKTPCKFTDYRGEQRAPNDHDMDAKSIDYISHSQVKLRKKGVL